MKSDRRPLIRETRRRKLICSRKSILLTAGTAIVLWLVYCAGRLKHLSDMKTMARVQVESMVREASIHDATTRQPTGKKIVILWTPFFSQVNYVLPLEHYSCPQTNCDFTSNKSLIREADAVMFHARDTNLYELPTYRRPDQRWILLHHEAPPNTPANLFEGLNNLINWTATYRTDSDVVLTPRYRKKASSSANEVCKLPFHVAANKTRLVAWFVSNCNTNSRREDFVQELRKTVTIDVYGSCGPYACHPKMSPKCYQTIEREYHFYLSLENAICKDYVTEKLFNIMDYNIIPIVFGGVDGDKFLPPKSAINVFDFKNTAALGQYLIQLAKDHRKYDEYFQWKSEYEMEPYQHYACQICSKLNSGKSVSKSWGRLSQWWYEESRCRSWSPANDE